MSRTIRIAAAGSSMLAAVLSLALSSPVALAAGDGVAAVSVGQEHSCARRIDGTVWCWGLDLFGQLGDGTTGDASNHRPSPVKVRRSGGGFLTGVTSVTAGQNHTCARRSDGSAWCWGLDSDGELGDGTTGGVGHLRLEAVRVRRGNGFLTDVTSVSAGGSHTCARRSDGSGWCWGDAGSGQLGDGTTGDADGHRLKAVRVRRGNGFLAGVTSVSAGGSHTCARRSDGSAWCWGADGVGQLGDGTIGDADGSRLKAVRVRRGSGFLTGVTAVSAGAFHGCARRSDGTAWCWGAGANGRLGDGTTGDADGRRLKAVRVRRAGGSLTAVTAASAGGNHSCARRSDGTAWCWGRDNSGQLGDGSFDDDPHPFAVRVAFP